MCEAELHDQGNMNNEAFLKIGATSADPDYLLDCVLEGSGIL